VTACQGSRYGDHFGAAAPQTSSALRLSCGKLMILSAADGYKRLSDGNTYSL